MNNSGELIFLLGEDVLSDPTISPQRSINLVNLHTRVWALIKLYCDEASNDEEAELFESALNILDNDITGEELVVILADWLPHLDVDFDSVKLYAATIMERRTH